MYVTTTTRGAGPLADTRCAKTAHNPEHNEKLEQLPEGWRQQWADTPWTSVDPDWPQDEIPIHRIEAQAGQCIIFTGA